MHMSDDTLDPLLGLCSVSVAARTAADGMAQGEVVYMTPRRGLVWMPF
jgi:hypothetical protein